jgi:hypothetical protein
MQPPGDDAANVQATTGSIRSKWNRKRIAALAAAMVLTFCLPVAIDQGYFRYNSYILPVGGLAALILYIGLLLTSKPMISWLHGLHDRFQNQPLAYVIVVGTAVALVMLFLAGGETLAINKSREHVAELRRRESAATTAPPPVKAASPETARKEPVEQPKATARIIPRKHQPPPAVTPSANPPASSASSNVPTVGSVTSINQSGGITTGVININSLPPNPGFGMLARQDVSYTGKPLAYFNSKQISADDKPLGWFYVAVLLSIKTQYQQKQHEAEIQSALKSISEIHGITVFFSPSPGGYTLIKDGVATTIGGNISGIGENAGIVYFDAKAEAMANRIKDLLHFSRAGLDPPNPNASNPGFLFRYDLWKVGSAQESDRTFGFVGFLGTAGFQVRYVLTRTKCA